MLSRTAQNLFWLSRYIERAENTARLLDVTYRTSLLPSVADQQESQWRPLLLIGTQAHDFVARYVQTSADSMIEFMGFDPLNQSSIFACVAAARENARAERSAISTEMKELAARAKEGKLQPHEYQGGTASLSNMGMFGIKHFEAVINPPQGMIMAIGAGEKRPYVINDSLQIATVMSATGSFDHRAIDGADGAKLMQAFKRLVENPLGMLA